MAEFGATVSYLFIYFSKLFFSLIFMVAFQFKFVYLFNSFIAPCGYSPSEAYHLENDVPQGNILSVTMFVVAINCAIGILPEGFHNSLYYVTDLSISFAAAQMSLIELAINRMSRWSDGYGFRFFSPKNIVMHFCQLRGVHPDIDLVVFICGHIIDTPPDAFI